MRRLERWIVRQLAALLLVIVSGIEGQAQPVINNLVAPETVGIYEKVELSFAMGSYANPYDPAVIDVYAEFISPEGRTFRANGFYYEGFGFKEYKNIEVASRQREGDCWKIRFTPNEVGCWTYAIYAKDASGLTQLRSMGNRDLEFECRPGNAEGFIRIANTRYLKREAFKEDRRQDHSFFPIGPNVAWYSSADYHKYKKPYGIYDYKRYLDLLSGNANYMRIWLTRYQYLSLYGPEHALPDQSKPVVYFDSSLNQKDAAELDVIVEDAAKQGVTLMPCVFTFGDFSDDSEDLEKSQQYGSMPSGWRYNPYHTILKLREPLEFFTDPEANRITANLLRYIVARWGYATNIVGWELWNEVGNVFKKSGLGGGEARAIVDWHEQMAALIRSCDPHQHLVTTSIGYDGNVDLLLNRLYDSLDVVQDHYYENIQKANTARQTTYRLYEKTATMRERYPEKPCFMGEYGINSTVSGISYLTRDPKGIDMHNSMWSSLFSGSMAPASFWYWDVLSKCELFGRFKPLLTFCSDLPILSDSFEPATTGEVEGTTLSFPDGFQVYFLINESEDTVYGWCQDVAFSYQALRRLTDRVGNNAHFVDDGIFDPQGYVYTLDPSVKPDAASSGTIILPMAKQRRGTRYQVRWYDAETGLEIPAEATEAVVRYRLFQGRQLRLRFPDTLRDGSSYANTFGDAVFVVCKISDRDDG